MCETASTTALTAQPEFPSGSLFSGRVAISGHIGHQLEYRPRQTDGVRTAGNPPAPLAWVSRSQGLIDVAVRLDFIVLPARMLAGSADAATACWPTLLRLRFLQGMFTDLRPIDTEFFGVRLRFDSCDRAADRVQPSRTVRTQQLRADQPNADHTSGDGVDSSGSASIHHPADCQ